MARVELQPSDAMLRVPLVRASGGVITGPEAPLLCELARALERDQTASPGEDWLRVHPRIAAHMLTMQGVAERLRRDIRPEVLDALQAGLTPAAAGGAVTPAADASGTAEVWDPSRPGADGCDTPHAARHSAAQPGAYAHAARSCVRSGEAD